MQKNFSKKSDQPYEVSGAGRIIIAKTLDSNGLSRCMFGGVLIPDITNGARNFELWDVEVTIKVRRKHKGSPMRGGTMSDQLVSALNYPENWEQKTFDTLTY